MNLEAEQSAFHFSVHRQFHITVLQHHSMRNHRQHQAECLQFVRTVRSTILWDRRDWSFELVMQNRSNGAVGEDAPVCGDSELRGGHYTDT